MHFNNNFNFRRVGGLSSFVAVFDASFINSSNANAVDLKLINGSIGATFTINISSDGGGAAVPLSGTISSKNQTIPGVDLSGLGDGVVTLTASTSAGESFFKPIVKDVVAPSAYSISFLNSVITASPNVMLASLEVGSEALYSFRDVSGNVVSGSFKVSNASHIITPDLSTLADTEVITAALYLVDEAGNQGVEVDDTAQLDKSSPTGHSLNVPAYVNIANESSVPLTIQSAELGSSFTITASDGVHSVSINGTVNSSSQSENLDLSTLNEGPVSFTLTLTDEAGNESTPVVENAIKDLSIPTAPGVTINTSLIWDGNTDLDFDFTGLSNGLSVQYSITSSGGGSAIQSSFIASAATENIIEDIASLPDGTITIEAWQVNAAGNESAKGSSSIAKDTSPPNGYLVENYPDPITADNETAFSFELNFPAFQANDVLHYSISGVGQSAITGTATIASAVTLIGNIDVSGFNYEQNLELRVKVVDASGNEGVEDVISVEYTETSTIYALDLDGSNDNVNFGDIYRLAANDVMLYAEVSLDSQSGWRGIIGKNYWGGVAGRYGLHFSDGTVYFLAEHTGANRQSVSSNVNLTVGLNRLLALLDRDGNIKLFVNGSKVADIATTIPSTDMGQVGANNFLIGQINNNGGSYLDGKVLKGAHSFDISTMTDALAQSITSGAAEPDAYFTSVWSDSNNWSGGTINGATRVGSSDDGGTWNPV